NGAVSSRFDKKLSESGTGVFSDSFQIVPGMNLICELDFWGRSKRSATKAPGRDTNVTFATRNEWGGPDRRPEPAGRRFAERRAGTEQHELRRAQAPDPRQAGGQARSVAGQRPGRRYAAPGNPPGGRAAV